MLATAPCAYPESVSFVKPAAMVRPEPWAMLLALFVCNLNITKLTHYFN